MLSEALPPRPQPSPKGEGHLGMTNVEVVHAASGNASWVKQTLGQTPEQALQPMRSIGLESVM